MKILISGISSSLGHFTAKELLQRGYQVRGFSRSIPEKKISGVEYISADLCSSNLEELTKDCDMVVHIAALSSPWGKKEDFFKVNAEGTKKLLNAAINEGCKRLVYISTPSIYFEYKDGLNLSEEFCAKRPINHYAASKLLAEGYVEKAKGLETFILRPKALFGPGDKVLVPRMLKALKSGGIPRFSNHDTLVDLTYIENVSYAIALCIEADKKYSGSKYNITNGQPVPLHKIVKAVLERMGHTYKERRVPYFLAKALAFIAEKISYFTNKEPIFTRYSVGALSFSQTLSIEKAQQDLGYLPKISIEEGIDRYGQWFDENNTL